MMNRIWTFLSSPRLAQQLMLAWLALLVLWVIPLQFADVPREIPGHIASRSLPFVALYAALAITTLVCMARRLRTVMRRITGGPHRGGSRQSSRILPGEFDSLRASRALRRAGFRKVRIDGGSVWSVRRPAGPLGTLLLHAGIVTILAAGLIAALSGSRFVARTRLTVGESFSGEAERYLEVVHGSKASSAGRLDEFTAKRVELTPATSSMRERPRVTLSSADGASRVVSPGNPWFAGPSTMITAEEAGLTVEMSLVASGTVVPLARVTPALTKKGRGTSTSITVNGVNYRVFVRPASEDGAVVDADGVYAYVSRSDAGTWRLEAGGEVLQPGAMTSNGEMRLRLEALKPNALLRVTRSSATAPLLAGMLLALIGVVLRLVLSRVDATMTADDRGTALLVFVDAHRDGVRALERIAREWEKEAA